MFIHIPAGFYDVLNNSALHWRYESQPEPQLNGRRMWQQRGKVLGGSSSINAMGYIRGHALDYDEWTSMGATGWSYAEVLPYFRKSETYDVGADAYRGDSGPLGVQHGSDHSPLFEAFIQAGVEAGYPRSKDVNGYQQEGFGPCDSTVWKGRRTSTATTFLHPIAGRANLETRTEATVTRVIIEEGRARGVEVDRSGQRVQISASREVVLCSGAFNSPQLLMLSGIGPGAELQRLGLKVERDLPGVGCNLMDHLCFYMHWECTQPVSVQPYLRQPRRWIAGLQWLLFKTGVAARTQGEAVAFMRSKPGVEHPDIQVDFLPAAYLPSYLLEKRSIGSIRHGFSSHIGQLRPLSRGGCGCDRPILTIRRRFPSTTSRVTKTGKACGPACVLPARCISNRHSISIVGASYCRETRSPPTTRSTRLSGRPPPQTSMRRAPAEWGWTRWR